MNTNFPNLLQQRILHLRHFLVKFNEIKVKIYDHCLSTGGQKKTLSLIAVALE